MSEEPLFEVAKPKNDEAAGSCLVDSVHECTLAFLSEVIDSKNELMKRFILHSGGSNRLN